MRRAGLLVVVGALAFLAGCGGGGGGGSSVQDVIRTNLLRVAAGWQHQDTAPFYAYYSEDYDFDGLGKADHLQSIFSDFSSIRNFRVLKVSISVQSATFALARMDFSMQLFADIASLDQATAIEAWANSRNEISQVWKRDFDGVWRIAAEYLAAAWVLGDSSHIATNSVLAGDQFLAGTVHQVFATAFAPDASYRVTLYPDSFAASSFNPASTFGWQSADYSGDFTVSSTAFGEYAFSWIGQADRPPRTTMIGRRIDAVFIVVSTAAGQKPERHYRAPTGIRRSVFRMIRIHGSAGQNPFPQPRPR